LMSLIFVPDRRGRGTWLPQQAEGERRVRTQQREGRKKKKEGLLVRFTICKEERGKRENLAPWREKEESLTVPEFCRKREGKLNRDPPTH